MKTTHSLDRDKIKIVLFEGIHPKARDMFVAHGYTDVECLPKAMEQEELIQKVENAYMIGVRSRTQVTAEVLEAARKLICVGCYCIGTNQVDLEAAATQGRPVFNAPHSNTRSVAELVLGLTTMLLREIFPKSTAAHRGEWHKAARGCYEVRGKTIGIIGYGHIGSQVSVLAESFGMRVLYYDVESKLPLGNAVPSNSLEEVLRESHVVTLHVPQSPTTANLIGAEQLAIMHRDSYLINASRGNVVDLDALAHSLREGELKGAAIDVFPTEPKSNAQAFESPLRGMDNVILTPHIGGSTQEAQENIALEVTQKLITFSDRGNSGTAVNFPQLTLVPNPNAHRILHIHRNIPGILSRINQIVGDEDINVLGQHLMTNQKLGYVVLDLEKKEDEVPKRLRNALKSVEGTIRSRVIY